MVKFRHSYRLSTSSCRAITTPTKMRTQVNMGKDLRYKTENIESDSKVGNSYIIKIDNLLRRKTSDTK